MKNIYKYVLDLTVEQKINAPIIKILDIQFQDNIPCMWAIVGDNSETDVTRDHISIFCLGTGTKDVDKYMATSLQDKYISTTQIGAYVFHWFYS
jgi:hypothetical protein